MMNASTTHPDAETTRPAPERRESRDPCFGVKLRPASHTYHENEGVLGTTLVVIGLCAVLIVAKLWLIKLLG